MSYNLDALTDDDGRDDDLFSRSSNTEQDSDQASTEDSSGRKISSAVKTQVIRHVAFGAIFVAAAVAGFLYRTEIMAAVGYAVMPVALWLALFTYLAFTQTGWIVRQWREVTSSAIIVLGIATVLGIYQAPISSVTGDTMGGRLGEIFAREPFEWYRYDLILWQQALAWARAGALFTIGAFLQFPKLFGTCLRVLGIGAMAVATTLTGLFVVAGGAAVGLASRRNNGANATEDAPAPAATSEADPSMDTQAATDWGSDRMSDIGEAEPYSTIDLDDLESDDALIDIGDTVYIEDKASDADIDPMGTSESLTSTLDPSDVAEKPVDNTDQFVAADVDELLDDEVTVTVDEPISSPVVDVADEVDAPVLDDFSEDVPDDVVADVAVSSDTEEVLQMITSGAAVEAAMHTFPWHLPPIEYLSKSAKGGIATAEIKATSDLIEETLAEHGVAVSVDQVRVGPTVTMYGLKPGWKGGKANSRGQRVRVDTILSREKDIALALSSPNIRFESVVPGSSVVGIEVPNAKPTPVNLRTVMDSPEWSEFIEDAALPVPLGVGSGGNPVMADFSKMPHTLVAGATGSGKSVCMNTIITGLLLSRNPREVRMVMIDPKRVELTPYQGIPHLYAPVIVEPEIAVKTLKALVKEMMDRFATLEAAGVRDISTYNRKNQAKMPYLLILVDELADLMLTASNEVEQLLVRLAQLGRATGVHLVVATQRPSVDVVTGLIKANFPSRISFAVGSQVDSRTILDSTGADKLLGKGDMLYKPINLTQPLRVQGAFLGDEEIEAVVDFWKQVGAPPLPQLDSDAGEDASVSIPGLEEDTGDALFVQASEMARNQKTLSTSLLQRRLRIGYPRAARLMDELEDAGVVGPGEPGKPRKVIANS